MVQNAAPLTAVEKELFDLGKEKFQITCAFATDERRGDGAAGAAFSELRLGFGAGTAAGANCPARFGGPVHVNGTKYEPPLTLKDMPALETMDDQTLAAVLTYIRREWNHQATRFFPAPSQRSATKQLNAKRRGRRANFCKCPIE
jgi:hypothetical protein